MTYRLATGAGDDDLEFGTSSRPLQQFLLHDVVVDDEQPHRATRVDAGFEFGFD